MHNKILWVGGGSVCESVFKSPWCCTAAEVKRSVTFFPLTARKVATKNTDIMQHLPNSWITTILTGRAFKQACDASFKSTFVSDAHGQNAAEVNPFVVFRLWNKTKCKQWRSSSGSRSKSPREHNGAHTPPLSPSLHFFFLQINPIKIAYQLRFHKVTRLCFGSVRFRNRFFLFFLFFLLLFFFLREGQSSSWITACIPQGYASCSSRGRRATQKTKTASDLETTAYFLGQLRDYVHLKSSERGRQSRRGGASVLPLLCSYWLYFV